MLQELDVAAYYLLYNFTKTSYIQPKKIHSNLERSIVILVLILIASLSSAVYFQPVSAANSTILINEVELNPEGVDVGVEKIELHNPSNNAIDVNGWTLSSTAGESDTIIINLETTIPPNGYVLIGTDSGQWLDNTGELIELRNDSEILIDYAGPFSDGANDDGTWQRSADEREEDGGRNWVFSTNTLGRANFGNFIPNESSSVFPSEHPIIEPETSLPEVTATNSSIEAVNSSNPSGQNLTIAFIDVGQGDSTLVIFPNTKTLLIDGGEREASGEVLANLQEHGLSHIDVVVATHPHADHIGGLVDVIKSVNVGLVLDSGQVHTTQTFEDFLDAIMAKQIPLNSVREGDSIYLDPTVKIDVLNPPEELVDVVDNEAEFNDNSVVLKLRYGEFSALLTGDMEETNEARLVLENATRLDADVLKAGHHGSRTSSSRSFLNAVTPEVVIISLGAGNTYGHPHKEALDRILSAGTEHLFRTDVDGTITLSANGSSRYSIVTENNEREIVVADVNDVDNNANQSNLEFELACCS
jgi:beta-lactamase superfamily II metal-dependent hydrolase